MAPVCAEGGAVMARRPTTGDGTGPKAPAGAVKAQTPAHTTRPTGTPKTTPSASRSSFSAPAVARSTIETHRAAASVGLVLLIVLALFAPLSSSAPDPALYLTPQVDGKWLRGAGRYQPGSGNRALPLPDLHRAQHRQPAIVLARSEPGSGKQWNIPPDEACDCGRDFRLQYRQLEHKNKKLGPRA